MHKGFLVFLLGAVAILATPTAAGACSCVGGTVADQVARADVVFDGEVLSFDGDHSTGPPWTAKVAVEVVYKGDVPATVILESPNQSTACGLSMREGTRWTFLADAGTGGSLATNLCSGSSTPPLGADELGLGAGHLPSPADEPADEPVGYSWWVVPGGILLGLVGGWLIIRRLQRRR